MKEGVQQIPVNLGSISPDECHWGGRGEMAELSFPQTACMQDSWRDRMKCRCQKNNSYGPISNWFHPKKCIRVRVWGRWTSRARGSTPEEHQHSNVCHWWFLSLFSPAPVFMLFFTRFNSYCIFAVRSRNIPSDLSCLIFRAVRHRNHSCLWLPGGEVSNLHKSEGIPTLQGSLSSTKNPSGERSPTT